MQLNVALPVMYQAHAKKEILTHKGLVLHLDLPQIHLFKLLERRTPVISCKLMFNLQEILWANLHFLLIHGHIFSQLLTHISMLLQMQIELGIAVQVQNFNLILLTNILH